MKFTLQNTFFTLCIFGFFFIFAYKNPWQQNEPIKCEKFLKSLKFDHPVLLIDLEVLKALRDGNCYTGYTVKLATEVGNRDRDRFPDIGDVEMTFFKNFTHRDYLEFETEPIQIIPKNFQVRKIGNVLVPLDIGQFLGFWHRAKLINCLNVTMNRNKSKPAHMEPLDATTKLALLRDELLKFGIFPFLNSGTLLGWYRECTIIPHTRDMDLAIFIEDFRQEYFDSIGKEQSAFKLKRKLGMLNDSFELTVGPKTNKKMNIDIFMLYKEGDSHWMGGMNGDGQKFKFIYAPAYDPWCSAIIHGHIFWVTCTPQLRISKEYGENWQLDKPTDKYVWSSPGVKNGRWSKEQMKLVYNVYKN